MLPTQRTIPAALRVVSITCILALLGVTTSPPAADRSIGASPNALQIFERAWQQWETSKNPPFVRFTMLCAKIFKVEACPTDYVRITMRTSDGQTYAQTVPSKGDSMRVLFRGGRIMFAGLSIGLFRSSRNQYAADSSVAPDPFVANGLSVIATVHSNDMPYDVTLDGITPASGSDAYELTLRPRRDPGVYPLRKLLVDVATYNIRSVTYERTPGNNTFFLTYDFAQAGAGLPWWVTHISWHDSLRILLFNRTASGSLDLSDIAFPQNLPNQDFAHVAPAASP